MKILELFSGYGSQSLALKYLCIEHQSIQCDIDKYAVQAYNQIHGETENLGDITKVDENKLGNFDLITYSFPCTDISNAGKQLGLSKDSGTRSSLLWECERIIDEVKPSYLLMENVKALVGKKFKHNFNEWLKVLDKLGYDNYWQVLNSKNYGVPQNRERVFVVSIRKNIDQGYVFPEKIPLQKRLKDVLCEKVSESYYLKDEQVKKFMENMQQGHKNVSSDINSQAGKVFEDDDNFQTLTAGTHGYSNGYIKEVLNTIRCGGRGSLDVAHSWDIVVEPIICASRGRNPENTSDRMVGNPTEQMLEVNNNGVSNTLTTVQKDNLVLEPKIIQKPHGFNNGGIFENAPTITANVSWKDNNHLLEPKIDKLQGNLYPTSGDPQAGRVYGENGISPALDTCTGGNRMPKVFDNQEFRIRRLVPLECFRLMGVKDEDFKKLQ
ncbi:MAG: DNA (cytosine-5-)-methyltransferase, partial [Clostridia bacterium]